MSYTVEVVCIRCLGRRGWHAPGCLDTTAVGPLVAQPEQPAGACPACGIDLYRAQLYSCPRSDCPCQPKGRL